MKTTKELPATHSMSTEWFVVDEDRNVTHINCVVHIACNVNHISCLLGL